MQRFLYSVVKAATVPNSKTKEVRKSVQTTTDSVEMHKAEELSTKWLKKNTLNSSKRKWNKTRKSTSKDNSSKLCSKPWRRETLSWKWTRSTMKNYKLHKPNFPKILESEEKNYWKNTGSKKHTKMMKKKPKKLTIIKSRNKRKRNKEAPII